MSKHARDRRPNLKPVTRLELSESNIKLRWIAVCLLLAVAVVSIGYGIYTALNTDPGWQEVTVYSDTVHCGNDFKFLYDFGAEGVNPTTEFRQLENLYSELAAEGFRLFSPDTEGADNLWYLNAHVNEPVTVASGLYRALEQIAASGSRHAFTGPVQEVYEGVFLSSSDGEAALYDPMKNEDLGAYAGEIAAYCADPEMIRLEILGENRVQLTVAPEYLAFAEENGIVSFMDLGWMTNAFRIDYIADALAAEGFCHGYLASYDGFTRNLDSRDQTYSQNIFHRRGTDLLLPATLEYSGPMSLVTLRDYPQSDEDSWQYYGYADGTVTSVLVDPADGRTKSAIDTLTAYSSSAGCAEILLGITPLFTADTFEASGLDRLAEQGIFSIRCHETTVVYTERAAAIQIADSSYNKCIFLLH